MSSNADEWYAVRCILADTGDAPAGELRHRYEERITLWRAATFEEAIERAEAEADAYCRDTGTRRIEIAQAFQLFAPPADGAEVFSLMRTSDLADTAYVDRFFDTGTELQQDADHD